MSDGVALGCAEEFGRFAERVARERRVTADVQDVMNHPHCKQEMHAFMDTMTRDYHRKRELTGRIWETIVLGTNPDNQSLTRALLEAGHGHGFLVDSMEAVASTPRTVNLVRVRPADFCFKQATERWELKDFFAEAKLWGLELCPQEVAPRLVLHRPMARIPRFERVHIASEPITVRGNKEYLCVWHSFTGEVPSLSTTSFMDLHLDGNNWVFIRPKRPSW